MKKIQNFEISSRGLESPSNSKTLIIWSFFLSFFLIFFFSTHEKTTPVRSCSTSPPGGNQVDGLPPAPSSGDDVLARRPNCDYLVPGRRNLNISRDLTIGSRNECHSQIQCVMEHRLVVRVCLGKFWMARTAAE